MRPRRFGEILDGAFQIYRRHAAALALTTLIPYAVRALPALLLAGPMTAATNAANMGAFWRLFLPIWLVGIIAMLLAWGALSWETSEAWIGGPVKLDEGFRVAGRSFFRLLGTIFFGTLLFYVALIPVVLVAAVAAGILAGVSAATGGGDAAAGAVAVVMVVIMMAGGLLTALVVGGWLSCMIPATVIEGLGPFRAIRRSFNLSRGAVLRSGATLLVAGLIVVLPMLGLMLVTGQLTTMFRAPGTPLPTSSVIIQQLGGLAASAFTTPFLMSVMTVLYYDRRVRTEALDVQMAAHDLTEPQPAAD
jgi:hypothetical protein